MDDLDTPLFPITVAAEAVGMAPGTLRMWFHRKRIVLTKGAAEFEPALVPDKMGVPRLLTLRTVLTLGAAAGLVRAGADAATAYEAAKRWTYMPTSYSPVHGAAGRLLREPAHLFSGAFTFLIYRGNAAASITAVKMTDDGAKELSSTPNPAFYAINVADLAGRSQAESCAPTLLYLDQIHEAVLWHCRKYIEGRE